MSADDRRNGIDEPGTCDESECSNPAAVALHIPWAEDRAVCPAHARVLSRPDGVVAEPIDGAEREWP